MAADIVTTVHRLKIAYIVQFIFLLRAVTEFAVYEAENKPMMFADKLITGYWSDWSASHVVPAYSMTAKLHESSLKHCEGRSVERKL